MPFLETSNSRLAYDDVGSGPATLFSHGFLMDRTMFAPQIEALRDRYRCISWDQRGFGDTGPARAPFSYWDSAKDALALLDHLDVPQAVLVGLSQGGFLSMRAALLAPGRVRGLVLISTRSGLDTQETVDGFNGLRAEWAANGAANVSSNLSAMLIGDGADAAPWQGKWARMSKEALLWPIDALTGRDDLTPRLGEISCPSLVIHGDVDPAIDVTHGEALARALPHAAGFVRIAGAGHAPPLTHAAGVSTAIERFLAGIA